MDQLGTELIGLLYFVKHRFQRNFSYIAAARVSIHAFLEFFFSKEHNAPSKPMAAFPNNLCQNNGQR